MELSKLKQRLELLYQEVERLEAEGGGGSGDSYTKAQTDALLAEKANKSDVYTKTNTYNKTEVNSEIGAAIADLDVSQTATTGHYIDYIAQEDGLIVPHSKLSSTVPTTDDPTLITSGAVAAALANKEDKITTIIATGTMENSTTIIDTGVSVDIPSDGDYWQVSGCITWKGSPPTEAQLRVKFGTRSSDYLIARAVNTNDDNKNFIFMPVSCTFKADAYYPTDTDKTIHVNVWGKTVAASGNCEVSLIARKIGTAT